MFIVLTVNKLQDILVLFTSNFQLQWRNLCWHCQGEGWLSALPIQKHGYALHITSFLWCNCFLIWLETPSSSHHLCLWEAFLSWPFTSVTVPLVVLPLFDPTKYMMWQPICSLKSAPVYKLSHTFNHLQAKLCLTVHQCWWSSKISYLC